MTVLQVDSMGSYHEDLLDIDKRILVINERSPFLKDLKQKLKTIYPQKSEYDYLQICKTARNKEGNEKISPWMRDYFFSDNQGQLVFPNPSNARLFSQEFAIKNNRICKANSTWFRQWETNSWLPFNFYTDPTRLPNAISGRDHYFLPESLNGVKIANTEVEGGNLIQAVNISGTPKAIVGFDSLLTTAFACAASGIGRDLLRSKIPIDVDDINKQPLYVNAAKKLLAEDLGLPEKDVVPVPHWIYHIDCMMAYLSQGIILLNSFAETRKLINDMKLLENLDFLKYSHATKNPFHPSNPSQTIGATEMLLNPLEKNVKFLEQEEQVVNIIEQQLTGHGFCVIKCPLVWKIITNDANENVFFYTNFANGFAAIDQRGKYHFITNKPKFPVLEEWLRRFLADLSVTLHCVATNLQPSSKIDTMRYMSLTKGGLRCQVNLIDKHHTLTLKVAPTTPVSWVRDSLRTHCSNCKSLFHLSSKKLHCNACGDIVCHNCLVQATGVFGYGSQEVGVCKHCRNEFLV